MIALADTPFKRCSRCKTEKPITEFYAARDRRYLHGVSCYCKSCHTVICRESRQKRVDDAMRAKDRVRSHHPDVWAGRVWRKAKLRAEKKGVEFSITKEDVLALRNDVCPVLGIPMNGALGMDNAPTIDRIDNSKGYVLGNIQVISFRANYIKGNASLEELKQLVKYLESLEK